ncbi:MAG: TetR/AcrR family transcriptional regulator [Enterococcus sp.]
MGKEAQIIAGLYALMAVDEYALITVTQIAQEAEIGRKTFYRYFKNKEEVLERSIELLFLEYSLSEENYTAEKYDTLIYRHFSFWSKHKEQLRILYQNDLMFYLFKHYQKRVSRLNTAYIQREKLNPSIAKYANAFTTGIFWSILYTWVETDTKETPAELAKICSDFLSH